MRLKNKIFLLKFIYINFILWLKQIKIEILKKEKVQKACKLRKTVYLQSSYIKEDSVPDIWCDKYDEKATNIGAFKNNTIIGAVRLVLANKENYLPVQSVFNLKEPLPPNTLEISKLVINKEFRGGVRLVFAGLMKKALNWSLENKVEHWVIFVPKNFCKSFKKFGANFEELETLLLTSENLKAREVMKKYYQKQNIRPYLLNLNTLRQNVRQ